MREIKFRAWDKEYPERKMSYSRDWANYDWGDLIQDKERFEVMQYTGLKDKNGKEIYEGDILEGFGKWVVMFSNGKFIFQLQKRNKRGFDPESIDFDFVAVIGNIYENPELLTKEKEEK